MSGVDFSKAVDEASRNLSQYAQAHVIQADIYHLPFRKEEFDLVYSLGVLHHLPDPYKGFESVVQRARPKGGGVLVYLYYALDNKSFIWKALLSFVTTIRKITTVLPKAVLYPVCLFMSLVFKLFLVIPAQVLKAFGMNKSTQRIPLSYYADKTFKILYNDTIDRFSAPIENRYSREQIREWYKRVGIAGCIIPDARPYWCAYGERSE